MKPIILTGFMGCGKSTIGQLLAQKTQCQFADVDLFIEEKAGKKISQIFEQDGEAAFRQLESSVLEELLNQSSLVLATGGGAVLNPKNRELFLQKGIVVFLKAEPTLIYERISGNNLRPLANGKSLEVITKMYQERMPFYEECHICYEVMDKTPLQCVNELIVKLREEGYVY